MSKQDNKGCSKCGKWHDGRVGCDISVTTRNTCGHTGQNWDGQGNCITCARDILITSNNGQIELDDNAKLTIDEAINLFAEYARGNGGFDELDLKEVIYEGEDAMRLKALWKLEASIDGLKANKI